MPSTYGQNGNRWWVGLNVGSDSTFSGADTFGTPGAYQTVASGNASDDAQFAAAAAFNKTAAQPNQISVQHIIWYNINGPYASQSQASAAIAGVQASHPAPGEIRQVTAGGEANAAAGGGTDLTLFSDVTHALSAFYKELTNYRVWRSLGWLILGVVMIFIGLFMWIGAEGIKKGIPFPLPV